MYSRKIRNILGDISRTNKFVVRFNDLGSYARDLDFTCTSTSIPSVQATTVDYKYKGHVLTLPAGVKYGSTWTATFYVDERHLVKKFFEDWIEMFDTRGEGISMSGKPFNFANVPHSGSMTDFTATVDIEQYDFNTDLISEVGTPLAVYRLYNVFPTSVPEIQLGSEDGFETLNVSFSYSYFERIM